MRKISILSLVVSFLTMASTSFAQIVSPTDVASASGGVTQLPEAGNPLGLAALAVVAMTCIAAGLKFSK